MHKSVLLEEAVDYLACNGKKVIVDCTVGAGGHAKRIINTLAPGGILIGIDADESALKIASENLKDFKGAFKLINENFRNFDNVLRQLGIDGVDGMLFDLGVSSLQLQDSSRGFSFSVPGPLDMRMNTKQGLPLWGILERLNEQELGRIIRELGQERFWRRIAKAIVNERRSLPIKDSLHLAGIVRKAVGYHYRDSINPATRTFQAFRIFINDELTALREALKKTSQFLRRDGRVVVISFHSLEDRIVKNIFKELDKEAVFKILTKKPITPDETEKTLNPRSRSAKLRAAQRL